MDNLIDAHGIADLLGVIHTQVYKWRDRGIGFPEPVARLTRTMVWSWPDVEEWARTTGRLSADGERLRPPRSRTDQGDD